MVRQARITELDGLRGVAILLVMASHMGAGTAPANRLLVPWWNGGGGGLVGVQLFFVLSGYLISGILIRELETSRAISFRRFYMRRVRRLMPALMLICAAVAVGSLVLNGDVSVVSDDIVLALTYTSNLTHILHRIFGIHAQNYWLAHTWSLAVEEQFYLAWPITFALAMRKGRVCALWVAILGAVATIAVRVVLPAEFMKLLRWDALLLGCMLAIRPTHVPRFLGWLGWAVILSYAVLPGRSYTGLDMTITAVGCALILARAIGNPVLRSPFLVWFGTISYGLYLWHVLVLRFGPQAFLGAAISIAIASASYYGLERRFLRPKPLAPTTTI